MRKNWVHWIAVILTISLLVSCTPYGDVKKQEQSDPLAENAVNSDDAMDKGPVKGGTLKLFSTKPDTLNPILTTNSFVQEYSSLIFESMVCLDKKQKPVPMLSDRWEVSPDGLTWTFHIRDNIFWHDKIPLAAEDIEFTMETILNSKVNTVYKKNVENIATFAAVDRNTFRIILRKPNSFTAELMTFPILPKHCYAGEDILKSDRNMKPVGTGPYKFAEYSENRSIKLVENENWWKSFQDTKDGPKTPYITEIDINVFPNIKDALNAFQTKDTDAVAIGPQECSRYSGRADLIIKKYTSRSYEFMAFNLQRPVLGDKIVRQAIANTIDKTQIINDVLPGEAIATDIPVIPDTWLYDSNILSYSPSASKARELLLQNGGKEQDGTMYKIVNGIMVPLRFELLVNDDNEVRVKAAGKIKEQLKDVGMEVTVVPLSWEDLQKRLTARQFDMVLLGWSVSSIPDISFNYSSAEISSGRNMAGYSNPDVDKYLADIMVENDANRKKALFLNMKGILNDEVPYIGLFFYNNAMLYNNRLRGVMNPHLWNRLSDVTQWYMPER